MRSLSMILLLLVFFVHSNAQTPGTPIPGWKMQLNNGEYSFTPANLFGPPNFHYDVYPPHKETGGDLGSGGGSHSGATGSVSAYSNKNAAGTYTFDGFSLELKYYNGTVVRKSFCF